MPHWSSSRPAISARVMIDLALERHGLSSARCIANTGLRPEDIEDPAREIEGLQELAVLRNILEAVGPEVPFALEAGLRYRATTHGMLGLMILTSPNLGEALSIGQRYVDLTYSFNQLGFELDAKRVKFLYGDLDNPEDLRAALVERDMAALLALEQDILGEVLPIQELTLRGGPPAYAPVFRSMFGVTPRWRSEENSIVLDVGVLAAQSPHADPFALRVCQEQCERLIAKRVARAGLAGRVRARILRDIGAIPNMEVVAGELGLSARTLRNQLRREGTSYRRLVEECRKRLAEQLLSVTDLTVERISERLGYSDPSSFVVAFRRWKGVAPRTYRSA